METNNLRLVPHAPEHLRAMIKDTAEYEKCFGLPSALGLRDFLVSGEVSPEYMAALLEAPRPDPWLHGFALVHHAKQIVVGIVSFKGPPGQDRTVEIAYGIAPGEQGHGYATEAVRSLIAFALASGKVATVCAHTLPEPNASTKVLQKCEFQFVGELVDPQDGLVWRWEKQIDLPK